MGLFSKKNKNDVQHLPDERYSYDRRESSRDFSAYNELWNNEIDRLNSTNKHQARQVNGDSMLLYGNDLSKFEFEKAARKQEQCKVNDYNFNENQDIFLENVKAQIFLETQKLLGGNVSNDNRLENTKLDEKYMTGDDFEDNIIRIASSNDPTLLEYLDEKFQKNKNNPYARGKDINSLTKQDQIYDSSRQIYENRITEEIKSDWESELTINDKNKIHSYSSYTQPNEVHSASVPSEKVNDARVSPTSDDEWKKYRDDIIEYTESKKHQNPSNWQNLSSPSNEQQPVVETRMVAEPEKVDNIKIMDDSFLVKTDEVARPSLQPTAPLIAANDRVTNVKDINDTEWEKIKTYIKDFNTNENSVAIGNTSTIVDADDALKVDLNAKFYLTPEQLKQARQNQLNQFQSVINDYENTLKLQEKKELQKAFDEMNKAKENKIKENEFKKAIDQQNQENLKIIDENIKLKNQIKELENKLSKTPEKPTLKNVELNVNDDRTYTLYPDLKNTKELIKNKGSLPIENKSENIVSKQDESPSQVINKTEVKNVVNEIHLHVNPVESDKGFEDELGSIVSHTDIVDSQIQNKPNVKLIKPKNSLNNNKQYVSLQNIISKKPETVDVLSNNQVNVDPDEISASIITPNKNTSMPNNMNVNKSKSIYANTLAKSRASALGSSSNSYAPYNDMIRSNERLKLSQYRNNNGMSIAPSAEKGDKIVSIKEAYGK